jgi:hypothetical protein
MDEIDVHVADPQSVTSFVKDEIGIGEAGHEADALGFLLLNVNLHALELEKTGEALDDVAEEVTADVIGMIMSDESADEPHLVSVGDLHEPLDVPSRVDDYCLARRAVANQIAKIHHLSRDGVRLGEVSAREELTEVEFLTTPSHR